MRSGERIRLCGAAILLLPALSIASNLPYNPTRIHLSSQPDDKQHAYILQPGSDSTSAVQLLALDISQSLDSSNLSPKSLSSTLPFLTSGQSVAYTSFVDQSGNITVLAGDCTKGADGATLWRLKPDAGAQNGGSWSQDKVESQDLGGQDGVAGANYLNSAIAFSEIVAGNATDTSLYAFGGMCPQSGASDSTWTTNAQYSNTMVTYAPQSDTAEDDDNYSSALVTSKGPPIAEAGMTMTPLSPTFSNTSGVQTQQQDFVVLGGHTQTAFINMSQAALFALPQAGWTFIPIEQPDGATSPSDPNFVSPRSGHTAVLTEDGRSIVIYGGWVGDVNTPATPQLVTLQLGSGYGGQGSWRWTPTPTPSGSFSGSAGIYGHGAVMLPGNVMMVLGGYSISSSSPKLVRRDGPTQNSKTFLYNVTSNAWISTYSAPAQTSGSSSGDSQGTTLTTPSAKAGVGVGVTFGVAALVGVGMAYAWHSKRSKRRRLNRDSTFISLVDDRPTSEKGWNSHTLTGGRNDFDTSYDGGAQGRESFPWLPQYGSQPTSQRLVDSTGAFLNIPSPTRGLRKPSNGRNYQYQATPLEEPRASTSMAGIHPIVETDEEGCPSNASSRPGTADAQKRLLAASEIFDGIAVRRHRGPEVSEDPFRDPEPNPLGSHPVSPEMGPGAFQRAARPAPLKVYTVGPSQQDSHVASRDFALPPSSQSSEGRSSPTKSSSDDRTLSSLSEMSSRSYASARSMARTTSTRSQAMFGLSGAPRISPQPSPTDDRTFSFTPSTTGRRSPANGLTRNRSVTSPVRSGHRPQMSFDALRSEGEALLGGAPDLQGQMTKKRAARPSSSIYSGGEGEVDEDSDIEPTSPSRKKLTWVGSIRKALGTYTGLDRTASGSYVKHGAAAAQPEMSDRSGTPSPTRQLGSSRNKPRRTASDSSAFLGAKRGKEDWDGLDASGNAWEPYRDEVDGGDWGVEAAPVIKTRAAQSRLKSALGSQGGKGKGKVVGFVDSDGEKSDDSGKDSADEDWDIEKAAEKRDVQVMFTVPKARLRVVNADPDRASVRSASEGSRKSAKSPMIGSK